MFDYTILAMILATTSYLIDLYLHYRQMRKNYLTLEPSRIEKEIFQSNFSQDQFNKTRLYNIDRNIFGLIKIIFSFALTIVIIRYQYLPFVWGIGTKLTSFYYSQIFIFILIDTLKNILIGLIFSSISTFYIEEKHGFNKTTLKIFITDQIKGFILGVIIQSIIIIILCSLMQKYKENFVYSAILAIIIFMIIMVTIYPIWIAPLFNKFQELDDKVEKEKQILVELEKLSKELNYPIKKIKKMDGSKRSEHSNAYFVGIFNQKHLVLFDTLINKLEVNEIVGVVSHEVGHQRLHHVFKLMALNLLHIEFMLLIFSYLMSNLKLYNDFGFKETNYFMGLIIFTLIYQQIILPIQGLMCGISRRFEYQADSYSLRVGKAKQLQSGLIKLYKDNKAVSEPDEIYAMFNQTHPNLIERFKALEYQMQKMK